MQKNMVSENSALDNVASKRIQETLLAAFSAHFDGSLRKFVGCSFRCLPIALRESCYNSERRPSSTGVVQLLKIAGGDTGRLLFPTQIFSEMFSALTGQTRANHSFYKAKITPVERLILNRLGEIIAGCLALSVPRAFALMDERGYAPHPHVSFELTDGSLEHDSIPSRDMWVIEVEIRSDDNTGVLTVLLPPLDTSLKKIPPEKFSPLREMWGVRQLSLREDRTRHLASGLSRIMRSLDSSDILPMLKAENDMVVAAFLSYAPPRLTIDVLSALSPSQARNIVTNMLNDLSPKQGLVDALYAILRKHARNVRQRRLMQRRFNGVSQYLRAFIE